MLRSAWRGLAAKTTTITNQSAAGSNSAAATPREFRARAATVARVYCASTPGFSVKIRSSPSHEASSCTALLRTTWLSCRKKTAMAASAENAEHCYRTMFTGRVSSWNLRDRHMAETRQALDT
jgi:erythromycin esterase-like protein